MIDGHEIHEYDHKYLHQKIALVGQEPVLFNRTIREHILYAVHHTAEQSSKEMVAAAKEANAHEFILSLSRGYETVCGQRGGHLSGKEVLPSILVRNFSFIQLCFRWTKTTCCYRSSTAPST